MRKARVKLEGVGAVYHCITRVVGGEMLLGELQKEKLRQLIRRHARFCGIEVITHCVMSNHFHLLVRVPASKAVPDSDLIQRLGDFYDKNSPFLIAALDAWRDSGELPRHIREAILSRMSDVSVFMKELKQRFTKWFNKQSGRFGTLWAERFKSVVVEDKPSVVRTIAAYIDLNPVRAGLVEDPAEYRWCGYAEAVAGVIGAREGFRSFHQTDDWRSISREYRKYLFIRAGVSGRSDKQPLDRAAIRKVLAEGGELALAETLRLRVRFFTDGVAIGSNGFVNRVFDQFRDRFGARRETGARRIRSSGALSDLCSLRNLRAAAIE